MRVLRDNAKSLVTVVQVFVHNPLYKWALDDKKRDNQREGQAQHVAPTREAERALVRMQLKLDGRVQGGSECLGVEGQVAQLIDQARAPENLSKMFEGWAAWL
jgi:ataxia telangiectasia mutated family protein